MLTIGEFSKICAVTKKTLRHYDEIGLLQPEHIAENGYRYYTATQLRTMLLISRLKNYGFSLQEISHVLENEDKDFLMKKIIEKQHELEQQVQNSHRVLGQMASDVKLLQRRMDIMDLNIVVKQVELMPQTVYGVRKSINVKDFKELFDQLFAEIGQKKLQPLGPPMAFYYDEDFSSENSDIEVGVPVAENTPGGHVLSGGQHAFATLVGPYEATTFTATYAGIVKWIEENGYCVCGAPFDKYVKGVGEVEPSEYITEIYFPIGVR